MNRIQPGRKYTAYRQQKHYKYDAPAFLLPGGNPGNPSTFREHWGYATFCLCRNTWGQNDWDHHLLYFAGSKVFHPQIYPGRTDERWVVFYNPYPRQPRKSGQSQDKMPTR